MLRASLSKLSISKKKKQVKKQWDPLRHLVPEILELIFSQLDTPDLYQCMLVSHEWHSRVPSLAALVWKTLLLQPRRSSIAYSSIPFSQYVRIVSMSYCEGMDSICDFLFAVVRWKCVNIHTLELMRSNIDDFPVFLGALKRTTMANKLRIIFIEECRSNLPILDILAVCPQLESLHYSPDSQSKPLKDDDEEMGFFRYQDIYYNEPSQGNLLLQYQKFENFKCLSIDWPMHRNRIRSILERCPNLRCIRLANYQMNNFNIQLNSTDPRRNAIPSDDSCDLNIFTELCPNLEYIECNNVDAGGDHKKLDSFWWKNYAEIEAYQHPSAQRSTAKTKQAIASHQQHNPVLRFLKFFGFVVLRNDAYNFDDLFNILERNQSTLEVLHLETCHLDERSSLLTMPKLRHLICRNFISSLRGNFFGTNIRFGHFLSRCMALERLEFNLSIIELIDDPELSHAIASLPLLKTLVFEMPRKLDEFEPRINNEGVVSILYRLGEPGIRCRLENLIFGKVDDSNIFSVPRGYALTSDLLFCVSRITSLRSIHLHHDDYYNHSKYDIEPNDEALGQFLRKTSGHLEKICISYRNMTPFIYQELGKMTALQELQLCKYAIPSINPENMDFLLGGSGLQGAGSISQRKNRNKMSPFKRLVIHCFVDREFMDPIQRYTSAFLEDEKGFYKIQKHDSVTFVKM